LHWEPRDLLQRAGTLQKIGADMIFEDLEELIPAFGRTRDNGQREGQPPASMC